MKGDAGWGSDRADLISSTATESSCGHGPLDTTEAGCSRPDRGAAASPGPPPRLAPPARRRRQS
eukprot:3084427-Alexandrium_andersonii.AAC.1